MAIYTVSDLHGQYRTFEIGDHEFLMLNSVPIV